MEEFHLYVKTDPMVLNFLRNKFVSIINNFRVDIGD